MHDPELERFKRDISLVDYATERHGYQRDRRESSRHCHVLRHPESDDKIVVRADPADGHWTYFSVRDGRDHGTIIDFLQHRSPGRLRDVREELRRWLGLPRTSPAPSRAVARSPRPSPAPAYAFARARPVERCDYLEGRGLRPETLRDPRFAPTWRVDARGNVLFVHRDADGDVTGFEIKSRRFTGFSPGGHKSAWQSLAADDDRVLVIAESAVDALSYHQLHALAGARYASSAGTLSSLQRVLFTALFGRLRPGTLVLAAVDCDAGGDALARELEQLTRQHPQIGYARHSPARDKDWNDVLQRSQRIGRLAPPGELENRAGDR
jgi:hypothetical protein